MARLITWLSVLLAAACANSALAQQQFPYVAYITKSESFIRSGPGQQFYPTNQLQPGFAVEVYRHDSDGWCAIRPPARSFSWVPAHQVRIVSKQVGRVIADQTVARVGSALSPARSAVQVLLKGGEQVELLDAGPVADGRWLRIVAPAGEFRWIAAKDLSLQPPMETTPPAIDAPAPGGSSWRSQTQEKSQPPQPPTSIGQAQPEPIQQLQPVEPFGHLQSSPNRNPNVINLKQSERNQPLEIVAGSPAELQLAQFQAAPQPPPLFEPAAPKPATQNEPSQSNGNSGSEMDQRIGELLLRLSQTVVQQPETWRFDQLRAEANSMLQQANAPYSRNQLRDFLDRILRFEQIQAGHRQMAMHQLPERPLPESKQTAAIEETGPETENLFDDESLATGARESIRRRIDRDLNGKPAANENDSEQARYDAVGKLKPVVSRKPGAPQFALVDKRGDVTAFVTPTPDLNLQPYVGRQIGVHGTRGYMAEFRRAHVTASRVSTIESEKSILK